jgi:phage tail P2-like protein
MASPVSHGFGHQPFGHRPFGHEDWAFIVLYESLPEEQKEEDLKNGYYLMKMIKGMTPSFNELKFLVDEYGSLMNPDKVREDLIRHLADSFGVDIDDYNPIEYRRLAIRVATKFNTIKGTLQSFVTLANIYGFNVEVTEMWWNGTEYIEDEPWVTGEEIGEI